MKHSEYYKEIQINILNCYFVYDDLKITIDYEFGSLFGIHVYNKKIIHFDFLYLSNVYKLYKFLLKKIDLWKHYIN
jgi:hypothetical protein